MAYFRFVADNLVTLEYKTIDEVLYVIFEIFQIFSVRGINLILFLESKLDTTSKVQSVIPPKKSLRKRTHHNYTTVDAECVEINLTRSDDNSEKRGRNFIFVVFNFLNL